MTAITVSAYSRTAPRGAVIAAEVFVWVLNGLRALAALAAGQPADTAVGRAAAAGFPA